VPRKEPIFEFRMGKEKREGKSRAPCPSREEGVPLGKKGAQSLHHNNGIGLSRRAKKKYRGEKKGSIVWARGEIGRRKLAKGARSRYLQRMAGSWALEKVLR